MRRNPFAWLLGSIALSACAQKWKPPNDPAARNAELLAAAADGDTIRLSALLAPDVDPDGRGPYSETALTSAAWSGHMAAVDMLIARGADVNAQDQGGDYALLFAAFHGHNRIVDALCKAGATVDLQNQSGHTAIMIAVVRMPLLIAACPLLFVPDLTSCLRCSPVVAHRILVSSQR